ncbi:acyloxyacyl hydrolase [Pontibacter sp. SGAir0037]|uniref:acyloxyacyl hydrolase n=1 Tax=Pontibacter sp. SGAir0037 TaxID=2571030 RepID=UPI0010CD4797|nr:acyloxyacyl hydrolase [Pontibacter sp. SGAir0037]QCR24116.1 hypothetical protein C1N53_18300 [Pontibacter sp. SGAir0037]
MFSRSIAILFTLLCFTPFASLGQSSKPFVIGASSQHAALLIHSPRMENLRGTQPQGVEINIQLQTTGSSEWHQDYNYPRLGVSLLWFDYNNPSLGHSFAISPYVSKPFHRSEHHELHLRVGTGLAYFTNRYDAERNPENETISNRLNATMQARLDYDYKIRHNLSLNAGLGFHHYSNGARRKPNLGLNLPTLSVGVNYYTLPLFTTTQVEREPFRAHTFIDISGSIGVKRLSPEHLEKYSARSFSIAFGKQLNRKSNLITGIEGFHDQSLYTVRNQDPTLDPESSLPDVRRVGGMIGHELVMGKLILETHLGLYLYRPYKVETFYYERLGVKYLITNNIFTAIDLKAHGGSANVVEFRLGSRLPFTK